MSKEPVFCPRCGATLISKLVPNEYTDDGGLEYLVCPVKRLFRWWSHYSYLVGYAPLGTFDKFDRYTGERIV